MGERVLIRGRVILKKFWLRVGLGNWEGGGVWETRSVNVGEGGQGSPGESEKNS